MDDQELDSFQEGAEALGLSSKRKHEQHLWRTWHEGGRKPEMLVPLMTSLVPLVKKQMGTRPPEIPSGAYEQWLAAATIKGIKSFNPERGVQLTTHVVNNFRRVTENVARTRNFGRIPKTRFDKYQQFLNTSQELEQQLGVPPTVQQLHDRLQWPRIKDVERMKKEIRSDLFGEETGPLPDSAENTPSRLQSFLGAAPTLLKTDEERQVFEHLFPSTGKPKPIGDIAKTLGLRPDRVYRVRSTIFKKLQPHLKGL